MMLKSALLMILVVCTVSKGISGLPAKSGSRDDGIVSQSGSFLNVNNNVNSNSVSSFAEIFSSIYNQLINQQQSNGSPAPPPPAVSPVVFSPSVPSSSIPGSAGASGNYNNNVNSNSDYLSLLSQLFNNNYLRNLNIASGGSSSTTPGSILPVSNGGDQSILTDPSLALTGGPQGSDPSALWASVDYKPYLKRSPEMSSDIVGPTDTEEVVQAKKEFLKIYAQVLDRA